LPLKTSCWRAALVPFPLTSLLLLGVVVVLLLEIKAEVAAVAVQEDTESFPHSLLV
jgi:hypothetical protein